MTAIRNPCAEIYRRIESQWLDAPSANIAKMSIGIQIERSRGSERVVRRQGMRQSSSGARAGEAFAAPGAERQFQRGFESDDASGQVLDMVLLLGDCRGERSTLSASWIVRAKASQTRSVRPMA